MKIQQVKNYKTPCYPTMGEARLAPGLLSRIPRRWAASSNLATLLGFGIMVRTLLSHSSDASAGETKEPAIAAVPEKPGAAPNQTENAKKVRNATSIVAPLLSEAIEHDGRGSFGCMVVNPPTFLAEDEALQLIRTELEAAGLKLEENIELANVGATDEGDENAAEEVPDTDEESDSKKAMSSFGRPRRYAPPSPTEYSFDFGDKRRSVFIDYLSKHDHQEWTKNDPRGSTVEHYDFAALAKAVSASLQKRQSDNRAMFGVFFDPLVRVELQAPDTVGLDEPLKRMAEQQRAEAGRKEYEHLDDKAKEKLRKQVRYFVSFLRQEGVLEKAR